MTTCKQLMYSVYILKSTTTGKYYIGMTENIERRLKEHNSGKTTSTKGRGPWEIAYREECADRASAWKRERQIKSYKGGEAFKKLLPGEVA